MNNVNLVGRLVRDPELKYGKDGKAILKNTVAVNRNKEQSDFINIVAFGKTAELIAEYHNKGDLIAVSGAIWTGSYDAQDGTKRYTFEVAVNSITFVKPSEKTTSPSGSSMGLSGANNSDPNLDFPF